MYNYVQSHYLTIFSGLPTFPCSALLLLRIDCFRCMEICLELGQRVPHDFAVIYVVGMPLHADPWKTQ